jgi:hypothetical protein
MYSSIIPASTYEKDLLCIGSDYEIVNSTAFSFTNFGRYKSPSGPEKVAIGNTHNIQVIY